MKMRFGCAVVNFQFFKCMTYLNRKMNAQGQHDNEATPKLYFFCLRFFSLFNFQWPSLWSQRELKITDYMIIWEKSPLST